MAKAVAVMTVMVVREKAVVAAAVIKAVPEVEEAAVVATGDGGSKDGDSGGDMGSGGDGVVAVAVALLELTTAEIMDK